MASIIKGCIGVGVGVGEGVIVRVGVFVELGVIVGVRVDVEVGRMVVGVRVGVFMGAQQAANRDRPNIRRLVIKSGSFPLICFRIVITCCSDLAVRTCDTRQFLPWIGD
jgi:hypothetical protein